MRLKHTRVRLLKSIAKTPKPEAPISCRHSHRTRRVLFYRSPECSVKSFYPEIFAQHEISFVREKNKTACCYARWAQVSAKPGFSRRKTWRNLDHASTESFGIVRLLHPGAMARTDLLRVTCSRLRSPYFSNRIGFPETACPEGLRTRPRPRKTCTRARRWATSW